MFRGASVASSYPLWQRLKAVLRERNLCHCHCRCHCHCHRRTIESHSSYHVRPLCACSSQAVPLFHFYLGDKLVDKFATRDKSRILETIQKHIPGFQAGEQGEGEKGE